MNEHLRLDDTIQTTWTVEDAMGVLHLLRRHVVLLVAAVMAGLAVMVVVMVVGGPSYGVKAKVLVRLGREMMAPPVTNAKESAAPAQPILKRPEDVASEVEIFTNPQLVQRTVESFGEAFFSDTPPETLWQSIKYAPKLVRRMLNDAIRGSLVRLGLRPETTLLERVAVGINAGMTVEPVRKSDVIEISLGFPDPRAGEAFLAKFLELAMQSHVEAFRGAGERQFLLGAREARNAELAAAEKNLLAVRTARDAIWSGPDQRALLLKDQAELQQQLNLSTVEATEIRAEIDHARDALRTIPADVKLSSTQGRNKSDDDIASRLSQLELDLVRLRSSYSERSPEIAAVQRQIRTLRDLKVASPPFKVDGVTTGPNPLFEQFSRDLVSKGNQLAGQNARMKKLTEQLATLRTQSRAAEALEIEIAQADRNIDQLRRSLDTYDKALEDARISETMDAMAISNLKLIMPPTAELIPSSPSIGRFLILGAVGGLALAVGFVLLRDLWQRRGGQAARLSPA